MERFAYFDTRVAFAVWLRLPLVPVMVNGNVPLSTARATVTVSTVELPVAGFGENVPVAPAGRPPLTDIVTGELKLPCGVIVTV